MLMYATICTTSQNTDPQITKFITAGFSGQLKGWWDNHLSAEQKLEILHAVKVEPGMQAHREDSVYTLIATICTHFIGDTSVWQERTQSLIMNLKCPTLTHYRWYADTFMTLVLQRHDSQSTFWKERFVSCLPPLFAEKVRNRLRDQHNGFIGHTSFAKCINSSLEGRKS